MQRAAAESTQNVEEGLSAVSTELPAVLMHGMMRPHRREFVLRVVGLELPRRPDARSLLFGLRAGRRARDLVRWSSSSRWYGRPGRLDTA